MPRNLNTMQVWIFERARDRNADMLSDITMLMVISYPCKKYLVSWTKNGNENLSSTWNKQRGIWKNNRNLFMSRNMLEQLGIHICWIVYSLKISRCACWNIYICNNPFAVTKQSWMIKFVFIVYFIG